MNRAENRSMPPPLRLEVERKPPAERWRIEQVWKWMGRLKDEPLTVPDTDAVPDTDTAWAELERRLPPAEAPALRRAPDRSPRRAAVRTRLVPGLVVAFVLLLLAGVWQWRQPVTVVAPAGRQLTVHLPDGSTVELNSATRLRYTRGFRDWPFVPAARRTVVLEGEAFFDVAHDERAFVVETFNARVEVLGTTFNVRARRAESSAETRVILASGRVRVTAPHHAGEGVLLAEAGATAVVADTTRAMKLEVRRAPLDQVLAWRRQGFSAVDEPVAAVLAEVERRYALRIETEAGLALDDTVYIVYRGNTTAEHILHDLCLTQGCRFRRTSNGFVLLPAAP